MDLSYENSSLLYRLIDEFGNNRLNGDSFDVIYIFYALHDVSKNLRNVIVSEFFRVLKNEGKLFIKEPQRENDGMPIEEIVELMKGNGFYEENFKVDKGTYSAVYRKIHP